MGGRDAHERAGDETCVGELDFAGSGGVGDGAVAPHRAGRIEHARAPGDAVVERLAFDGCCEVDAVRCGIDAADCGVEIDSGQQRAGGGVGAGVEKDRGGRGVGDEEVERGLQRRQAGGCVAGSGVGGGEDHGLFLHTRDEVQLDDGVVHAGVVIGDDVVFFGGVEVVEVPVARGIGPAPVDQGVTRENLPVRVLADE
ncbi:hypothetical protein ebA7238 [Aromatoleum aromaticum EbN1]|uniref:Uncharacterized protein n=1 Tax=Aromatoleum aromaticum (strain DSM 19018 / LMG 30748 / EbN1) TaxID=76114 RepID=Q5NXI5_AROAE|nr:hypothetical protein ebA7238 [Aromatoleum aromaticum EbN1]